MKGCSIGRETTIWARMAHSGGVVGGSFRNPNRLTMAGGPISLGLPATRSTLGADTSRG
jgi:hypothetical protein